MFKVCMWWWGGGSLPPKSFPSSAGGRQERQSPVGVGLGLDSLPNRQRPPMFSSPWELLVPKPRFIFVHCLFRGPARLGGAFEEPLSGFLGRRRRFYLRLQGPGLPSPHWLILSLSLFSLAAPETALLHLGWLRGWRLGRSRSKR